VSRARLDEANGSGHVLADRCACELGDGSALNGSATARLAQLQGLALGLLADFDTGRCSLESHRVAELRELVARAHGGRTGFDPRCGFDEGGACAVEGHRHHVVDGGA
jgi:hypothetical protein